MSRDRFVIPAIFRAHFSQWGFCHVTPYNAGRYVGSPRLLGGDWLPFIHSLITRRVPREMSHVTSPDSATNRGVTY